MVRFIILIKTDLPKSEYAYLHSTMVRFLMNINSINVSYLHSTMVRFIIPLDIQFERMRLAFTFHYG